MDWLSFTVLAIDKQAVTRLKEVKVLDMYEGATKNFHPEGLYSTEIFGAIGSEERDTNFGYIDVGIDIIAPAVALTLFELKRLYKDVMSGKRFALWDAKAKDFEPAAPGDEGAGTGYSFFMEHYSELTPKRTGSLIREQSVDIFNEFREVSLSQYVLVLNASQRDLEVKPNSQEKEDDVNPLYRKLINTAKSIPRLGKRNNAMVDTARWKLQENFCAIYSYFFDFLDGKHGHIRGKWSKRNLQNGTRNVLSSMDASSVVMDRADEVRPTDTVLGLFQGLKSILPVAVHRIHNTYLPKVDAGNGSLYLIDRSTFKRKMISVSPEDYDKYTTDEGAEKLINLFKTAEYRQAPLTVNGHYVALIYEDGKNFKILYDISELPDGYSKKHVSGLTLAELLYLSGYDVWNDYFTLVTRYPIAGQRSTYSSTIRLTTTSRTTMRYELEDDWVTVKDVPAIAFPVRSILDFINSMAPHPSNLKGLVADFDGDTGSADSVYTDESLAENKDMMSKASFWISSDNALVIDINVDTIDRTVFNLLAD